MTSSTFSFKEMEYYESNMFQIIKIQKIFRFYLKRKENKRKLNLEFDDISVFFKKYTKNENDKTNKIREELIENLVNNKIPKTWYSSPEWFKVKLRLNEFIKNFKDIGKYKECIRKSGRKYNYDFLFIFEKEEVKIEFKNGVSSITEYPEILSVSSNKFVSGLTYAERFYDFYLSSLTNEELPTKDFYLKNIYKNKVNHPFFIHLKEVDNFKITVDESIDDYLVNYLEIDYAVLISKIKESQSNKKFMLWDDEQFHLDYISEDEFDIIPEKTLKKGKNGYNTVILTNKNKTVEYHMLLRWKNHAGVLFPAWQIKFKRK